MFEFSWGDALEAAAKRLPAGDPDALVFFESRTDLRVGLEDGVLRDHVATRYRGCSARRNSLELHISDPSPDEIVALAAARGSKDLPRGGERTQASAEARSVNGEAASGLARGTLRSIWDRIHRSRGGSITALAAALQWIGFRQQVMSARPELPVRGDLRECARVRITVRVRRGSAQGEATVDQVIRTTTTPDVLATLADDVVGRAIKRIDARAPTRGDQSAVFAPGVGGILIHELVGHALEADTVQSGQSALAKSLPGTIPPSILVMDDPRRGRAAWRWDDEGEEARAVPLLQSGRVAGSIHDLRSARRARKATTGHGRRSSYLQPVLPRMGCTFLAPGRDDPGEIVRATSRGVYVRRMESAGTDPASGRAFFRVTDADRILNGRIEEPLTAFLICLDGVRALSTLDRVADDLAIDTCIGTCVRDGQPLAISVGTPTCRVGVISVFL